MKLDADLQKAVNGWKQAVSLLERTRDGLTFALAEIERINKEHPRACPTDTGKALAFADAQSALNICNLYLKGFKDEAA